MYLHSHLHVPAHVQTKQLCSMCAAVMEKGLRTNYQERQAKSDSPKAQGNYEPSACLE